MPLLLKQNADAMLARPPETCESCKSLVSVNYCRQCDESCTDGHSPGCELAKHVGHRGYDANAPAIGTSMHGFLFERDYGSYRINAPRGPVHAGSVPDVKDTKAL